MTFYSYKRMCMSTCTSHARVEGWVRRHEHVVLVLLRHLYTAAPLVREWHPTRPQYMAYTSWPRACRI